jgi:single-strand DNA-binding protein
MASFNKVIVAGNLTRDPELRYTPNGKAIAKFALAVNRNWTTETGEKKEEVTFIDIDAFGRQAEVISQYMKKGRALLVEGRLKLDQWDDKQTGQKRSRLGVVLESFSFIDGGRAEGGPAGATGPVGSAPVRPPRHAAPAPSGGDADGPPPSDDDVPF